MTMMMAAAVATMGPDCPPDDITAARLYRVLPGARVAFYRTPDCADASCGERAYVVGGDRVVVYQQAGRRSCALFERTRETVGWIDSDRLAPDLAAALPPASAWAGDWYEGDDHIRLRLAGAGRLRVDGDAYWPGKDPVDRPGGPNIGQLGGVATPVGDRIAYSDGKEDYACRATLRLLGDYLLVEDDGSCGGQNVRFSGVYRRRSAHRPATKS